MFADPLAIELTLTIAGTPFSIPGAQVKRLAIDLHWWGFEGEVEFWLAEEYETDRLVSSWKEKDLVEVYLAVAPVTWSEVETAPAPLALKGLGTEKRLHERIYKLTTGAPSIARRYTLRFADAAQVLWKQHFPTDLHVETAKMKDVIDAHKGAKIKTSYDWPELDVERPIIFLGLGDPRNDASFYDLLIWYVRTRGGVFTYESDLDEVQLTAAKPELAEATALPKADVAALEVVFPESPRYDTHVLNSYVGAAEDKEVKQEKSVTGIRRDVLLTTSIAARVDARVTVETAKLVHPEPEVHVTFAQFPRITFRTGTFIAFSDAMWSDKLYCKTKTYRVQDISFRATNENQEATADPNLDRAGFRCEYRAVLEDTADTVVRLPPFRVPRFPVHLEGKIVSETGDAPQETYQIYTDSNTSVEQYKVEVPLFANKKIVCDFNPNTLPGHFFFPAYKGARVLVALDLETAWIKRFLDWRPGAKLPADGQGNHLLLGKKEKDQTSISHVYVDSKPVLKVKRNLEKAVEYIEIKEGAMVLHTEKEK